MKEVISNAFENALLTRAKAAKSYTPSAMRKDSSKISRATSEPVARISRKGPRTKSSPAEAFAVR
jgi:hypothetical protein